MAKEQDTGVAVDSRDTILSIFFLGALTIVAADSTCSYFNK